QLDQVPANYGPSVLSVGNFDGVHLAHRNVLREVVERARELGARALAVTFDPHPVRVLRPGSKTRMLTPTEAKLELLRAAGLDAVLVLPFTRQLSEMSPADFARRILAEKLNAREVHEGFNFRFGHDAAGDVRQLEALGRELGFSLREYPEMRVRGDVVSSSRIRQLIAEGRVTRVQRLLGRPFSIAAPPASGRGVGHRYTVPTINLARYDELLPGDGVYITCTEVGGECFQSVSNVGSRPTFDGAGFAVETHLLNFHPIEVAPESDVKLSFLYRLRPEIRFPGVEALRAQIARDVKRAQRYFRACEARNLAAKR